MTKELNCRGLACSEPVMQLKELFKQENPEAIAIFVDNEAAKENVIRFLELKQFKVAVEELGSGFRVTGSAQKGECGIMEATELPGNDNAKKIMVMVGTDRLGHGDDGLGKGLLINFLKTVNEMHPDLWRLVFVNSGVFLTAEGSEAVPILQGLADQGVGVLVCGTCLNHFKLHDKKQVGETTNMLDIVTSMQLADNVINI